MKDLSVSRMYAAADETRPAHQKARPVAARAFLLTGLLFAGAAVSASGVRAEEAEPMKSSLGHEADLPGSSAGSGAPGQQHAADDINVTEAWMQHVGRRSDIVAAYFTIENHADTAHLIENITSPACSAMFGYHSELEASSFTRGLFTHLTIPAQQTLVFPPGGYHLVCTLAPGKTVEMGTKQNVTFHFLGGSQKTVSFDVRGAKPPPY